ncbi:uncharacterized protein LOC144438674 [Glandiceps talaboti]
MSTSRDVTGIDGNSTVQNSTSVAIDTSTSTPSTSPGGQDEWLSYKIIAGVAVGVLVLIVIFLVCRCIWKRRRNSKQDSKKEEIAESEKKADMIFDENGTDRKPLLGGENSSTSFSVPSLPDSGFETTSYGEADEIKVIQPNHNHQVRKTLELTPLRATPYLDDINDEAPIKPVPLPESGTMHGSLGEQELSISANSGQEPLQPTTPPPQPPPPSMSSSNSITITADVHQPADCPETLPSPWQPQESPVATNSSSASSSSSSMDATSVDVFSRRTDMVDTKLEGDRGSAKILKDSGGNYNDANPWMKRDGDEPETTARDIVYNHGNKPATNGRDTVHSHGDKPPISTRDNVLSHDNEPVTNARDTVCSHGDTPPITVSRGDEPPTNIHSTVHSSSKGAIPKKNSVSRYTNVDDVPAKKSPRMTTASLPDDGNHIEMKPLTEKQQMMQWQPDRIIRTPLGPEAILESNQMTLKITPYPPHEGEKVKFTVIPRQDIGMIKSILWTQSSSESKEPLLTFQGYECEIPYIGLHHRGIYHCVVTVKPHNADGFDLSGQIYLEVLPGERISSEKKIKKTQKANKTRLLDATQDATQGKAPSQFSVVKTETGSIGVYDSEKCKLVVRPYPLIQGLHDRVSFSCEIKDDIQPIDVEISAETRNPDTMEVLRKHLRGTKFTLPSFTRSDAGLYSIVITQSDGYALYNTFSIEVHECNKTIEDLLNNQGVMCEINKLISTYQDSVRLVGGTLGLLNCDLNYYIATSREVAARKVFDQVKSQKPNLKLVEILAALMKAKHVDAIEVIKQWHQTCSACQIFYDEV